MPRDTVRTVDGQNRAWPSGSFPIPKIRRNEDYNRGSSNQWVFPIDGNYDIYLNPGTTILWYSQGHTGLRPGTLSSLRLLFFRTGMKDEA